MYKDCKAFKGQVIANQLAEAPLQGDHPIIVDFPDDTIMIVTPSHQYIWTYFFMWECQNCDLQMLKKIVAKLELQF